MPDITVRIDGADAVRKRLSEIAERAGNLSPIMQAIGARVTTQTKDRFRRQGPAPDGTPWTRLKSSTLKSKRHSKILTESTALRDSIHYQVMGPNRVAIGAGGHIPYAAIHQFGGDIRQGARSEIFVRNRLKSGSFKKGTKGGRGFTFNARIIHMPARPFLGLSRANSDEVLGLINQYIAGRR
ncbi:MAG TPA: phage virion morphogenesis protein [Acidobacteriota bacterium]|nr:phage virion morphogenesis protein [Acidobacteriota bacterium]